MDKQSIMKSQKIIVKLKNLYENDPVDRFRGINIVKELTKRGWNIELYNNQKNIDLIIYLDSLNIDRSINAKCTILDIQDNHLNKENPASLYIKRYINESLLYKTIKVLKKDPLSFLHKVFLRRNIRRQYFEDIKNADTIICSSHALQEYYSRYNNKTVCIPDAVEHYITPEKKKKSLSICWVGTKNNIVYLKLIEKAIDKVQNKYSIQFVIISSDEIFKDAALTKVLKSLSFKYKFVKWEKNDVAEEISKHSIAVAPLPEGAEKSTNKILAYMASGTATVCSGAKDYALLYRDNPQSFVFLDNNTEEAWYDVLSQLIENTDDRYDLSKKGFILAQQYSLDKVCDQYEISFAHLLKELGNENG